MVFRGISEVKVLMLLLLWALERLGFPGYLVDQLYYLRKVAVVGFKFHVWDQDGYRIHFIAGRVLTPVLSRNPTASFSIKSQTRIYTYRSKEENIEESTPKKF